MNEEDQRKTCLYLNSVRSNFTACCEYPAVVIWVWQYEICVKECENKPEDQPMRCCILICGLNMGQILNSRTEVSELLQPGYVYSFMLSIGNETLWEPVITNSVSRCFTQFLDMNAGFDCEIIPVSVFSIANCAYLENYLKCPKWNPDNIQECEYTSQYAKKCTGPTDMSQ